MPRDPTRKEIGAASPERFRFPLRPAPKPRPLADGTIEWAEWRGSPELLAHVVDTAETALREYGTGLSKCSIVVTGESEPLGDVRDRVRAAVDRGRPRRYDVPVMTGGFIVAAYSQRRASSSSWA